MAEKFYTRSDESMLAWALGASGGEIRAVRAEARRDMDTLLVDTCNAELVRRGLERATPQTGGER